MKPMIDKEELNEKIKTLKPQKQTKQIEEGEVIDDNLPYKRPTRKRGGASTGKITALEKPVMRSIKDNQKLLVVKRIMDCFNSGNIDEIKDIIYDSVPQDCEVNLTALNIRLMGGAAVFALMTSLAEAFPSGCFRTSDTLVDDDGKVFIRFVFSGIKLYELVFDTLPSFLGYHDSHRISQSLEYLMLSSQSRHLLAPNILEASMVPMSSFYSPPFGVSNNLGSVTAIGDVQRISSPVCLVSVDRRNALLNSMGLLVKEPVQNSYQGVIVMSLNEACMIKSFDVNWKEC